MKTHHKKGYSIVFVIYISLHFFSFLQSKEIKAIGPTVEISEYHWFHREKVELYMAELYNKVGKCFFEKEISRAQRKSL